MDEIPYIDGASSSSSAGNAAAMLTKDEDFFIESTFVVFQVEDRLFRVPSYMFFKESPTFVEIFNLPPLSADNHGDSWPGMNSEHPIVLPDDVGCEDFKNLLKALYPRSVALRLLLSKSEWVSILRLSTKWRFLDLRKLAKSELEAGEELTSVEKIILGREFYHVSWIEEGYKELVQKTDTITDDEAISIELPTAINLFRIREIMLRISLTSAFRFLENVFAEELSMIGEEEIKYRTEQEEALVMACEMRGEERRWEVERRWKEEERLKEEKERLSEEMLKVEERLEVERRWNEGEILREAIEREKELQRLAEEEAQAKLELQERSFFLPLTSGTKKKKKRKHMTDSYT